MVQAVQQDATASVANGQVPAVGAEGCAVHVVQRRLGRGPVAEHGHAGDVQHPAAWRGCGAGGGCWHRHSTCSWVAFDVLASAKRAVGDLGGSWLRAAHPKGGGLPEGVPLQPRGQHQHLAVVVEVQRVNGGAQVENRLERLACTKEGEAAVLTRGQVRARCDWRWCTGCAPSQRRNQGRGWARRPQRRSPRRHAGPVLTCGGRLGQHPLLPIPAAKQGVLLLLLLPRVDVHHAAVGACMTGRLRALCADPGRAAAAARAGLQGAAASGP